MKNNETEKLIEAAEQAVERFEGVNLGLPFSEAAGSTALALDALVDPARRAVFPKFVRGTADAIATFEFHEQGFERSRYGERVADLHAACLDAQPDLAAFLRGGVISDRATDEWRVATLARQWGFTGRACDADRFDTDLRAARAAFERGQTP